MASGSYAKKSSIPQQPEELYQTPTRIPARATRQLPALEVVGEEEPQANALEPLRHTVSKALDALRTPGKTTTPLRFTPTPKVVDEYAPHPLERHTVWLRPLIICMLIAVAITGVLLSASMNQREGAAQLMGQFGGKVYDVQVGGSLADSWQKTNAPITPKVPVPRPNSGPYTVLGKPTISADFINQVLVAYNSPAAGKGQSLYDLGVKYEIDPAFALAFFQHESTFGKFGEARSSLSLGNLRCIPDAECKDNYAWFPTWEAGFEAWYKLIRNLYVAQWGFSTVEQIIPKYAPSADNNDEQAYISSVKHSLDVWRVGQINA